MLLVVVAGWGVGVDGYDKLPNGDGSSNLNAGTLRGELDAWNNIAGNQPNSNVYTKYGPIEEWDVSDVSNMNFVFHGYQLSSTFGSFNADLSKWQTGKVTTMYKSKCTLLGVVFFLKTRIGDSHFFFYC